MHQDTKTVKPELQSALDVFVGVARRSARRRPNGYIIYRGPSMLDGAPIVVIATGFAKASANGKTGALIQTWILRDDLSPRAAVNAREDSSICGDCVHRGAADGSRKRTCYVRIDNAPRAVWTAVQADRYTVADADTIAELTRGLGVRLGSYGDPAAVPLWVWEAFTRHASFWTGYTHQYRDYPELAPYCMASADSQSDRAAAKLLGFRVFRVRGESEPLKRGEIACPASAEAGHKTTCDACKLCMGATSKSRRDIAIVIHGAVAKSVKRNGLAA